MERIIEAHIQAWEITMATLRGLVRRIPFSAETVALLRNISSRIRSRIQFRRDFHTFREMASQGKRKFSMEWGDRYPCLDDNTAAVSFSHHYFYHLGWAAQVLSETRPSRHTDISSHIYFAGIMSGFMPFDYYEFRDAGVELDNLNCRVTDLECLPFANDSIESLSCMHVVEHVGLGRYGDRLDPDGDIKAMGELKRVVAEGGDLLFVVPVGKPKIEYNAHRIYSYEQVVAAFPGMRLRQFALIRDRISDGGIVFDADPRLVDQQRFGCGCFWFVKESSRTAGDLHDHR